MRTRLPASAAALGLLATLVAAPAASAADPELLLEDFEDATVAYSTSVAEFSDGAGDFFTRTDGTTIGSFVDVSGQEGQSWFHGMDLDGEGAVLPLTMTFSDIDVSSFASLGVSLLVAEDDDGSNQDWDDSDSVRIEASLDGGGLVPVLCFANDGSQFNTAPLLDADCDGTGDGTEVVDAFATFSAGIAGTADSLDLVITWDLDSGDEDLAIDDIRITAGGDGDGGDGDGDGPTGPTPLPISEGFDDCTLAGWEIVSVDADTANTWSCSEQFSNMDVSGFGDDAPADEWLILPLVDLTAQDDERLSFRSYTNFTDVDYPQLEVLVSTDYPRTGDPADGTWTALDGFALSPEDSGQWTPSGPIDLSSIDAATVSVAFRYTSSGTGPGSAANWRLDAVELAAFVPECTETDTLISAVQGDGFVSPFVGDTVTIQGVVTQTDAAGGFFLQEEPADDDGNPATSEGIYVFRPFDFPEVGTTLQLTDQIDERSGLTQMAFPDVEVCDVPLVTIAPTSISLPIDDEGRESLEGMLVTTAQDLVTTATFSAYRFGEIGLTVDEPLTQPTSVFAPGPEAQALADENAANFLKIDDNGEFGRSLSPWADGFDAGAGEYLSAGDVFAAGITGGLTFTFGEYKILPVEFPTGADTDVAPAAPQLDAGNDVAAFNVLNYFNTFGNSEALRGARNQAQFDTQEAKIVHAINTLDAAVLGLIEIENDYGALYDGDPSTEASIVTLVDALNQDAGFAKWDFVAPAAGLLVEKAFDLDATRNRGATPLGVGTDAIANGIIFQPERAEPTGTTTTFDIDALLEGDADNSRWPVAQSFQVEGPGPDVTVAVNHFKSKGSTCEDVSGPSFALGEDEDTLLTGSCNLTRVYAAERLAEWLDTRPTGVDHDRNLVVGDLNSYEEEDPIVVLEAAGYLDNVEAQGDDAFTYKFDGRYGRLDYVMASADAQKFVLDTEVWQINSRTAYGYLYFNEPQDLTAYGSSDHDPVVVSIGAPGQNKRQGPPTGGGSGPR